MRIIQFFIIFFSLVACQYSKDELIGHWRSLPESDGYYWTLDITDSTTQFNKYSIHNPFGEVKRFYNDKGDEGIYFLYEEYWDLRVVDDTLLIAETFKFFKVDEPHHLDDHFNGSLVHINLPKPNENAKPSLEYRKSQLSHILIGPAKETIPQDIHVNEDLTCFQTLDELVTSYKDLQMFAQYEDDKLPLDANIWLIIHADSSTSRKTIDTLISLIEPLGVTNGFILSSYHYELDRMMYEELN